MFGHLDKGRRATTSGSPELRHQCWHLHRGGVTGLLMALRGRTEAPKEQSSGPPSQLCKSMHRRAGQSLSRFVLISMRYFVT